jgi:hypothetical protein
MKHSRVWCFATVISLLMLWGSARAFGQTDPRLLVLPWDDADHQAVDTSTEGIFGSSLPTQEDHRDDVRVSEIHSYGRWRLFPDSPATPRLGYDVLYYDIDTTDRRLPQHLFDGTVGFAQPVAEINKYFVVVTAAAGYAGDSPFNDPHAVFFTGNIIVGRKFSEDKALITALNYDGNRTFLPGIPIPALEYKDRYNEFLTYTIGAPLNSITYKPINGLQVDLGWEFVTTFNARVGYEFLKHYSFYGNYADDFTGFHQRTLSPDHRLFFEQHRAEVGFRYNATRLVTLSVAGGWAFGQEFSQGYDATGQNPVRHLRDGPYARALLEIGF